MPKFVFVFFSVVMFGTLLCHPSERLSARQNTASANRTTPVEVGRKAPDFSLQDQDGQPVKLSALRGKSLVVLVFYRGSWCPFCVRQLTELGSLAQSGENVRVLAISVDSVEENKKLAQTLAAKTGGQLSFSILSDPGHQVIDRFGLHDPAYDGKRFDGIPHPAVYVLDKAGKVTWARVEQDYKLRPAVSEVRAALDQVKK